MEQVLINVVGHCYRRMAEHGLDLLRRPPLLDE